MQLIILTIFPDYFQSVFTTSILKRAVDSGVVKVTCVNIRDFATDKHRVTDDRPYGGGAGMVMKVEPIDRALQFCREKLIPEKAVTETVLLSAKGEPFHQQLATDWSKLDTLVLICGHYEGVDERVAQHLVDAEVRIGDYVLTGGEPAAAVIADAVCRLVPGVVGNEMSLIGESHEVAGQLGYPQYTRPEEYRGWEVPEELLTGHHAQISAWRHAQRQQSARSAND